MDGSALALLAAAAFGSSILSAIVGMAGGIVLLAVLLLFVEPLAAIPLHGVIQLLANGSRTLLQRRHVRWSILSRYALLLVPAGILGILVVQAMPASATRIAIGVFVLLATWAPGAMLLGTHPEQANPRRRFFWLGGAAGFLHVTLGAVGPLMAPFFLNLGLTRQALVGTKAACQTLSHGVKILLFGLAGFAFLEHGVLLLTAGLCVLAGTWVGTRLLDAISERLFVVLYKVVLTLIAGRLIGAELLG